jgi:valyl-tRNA synthetase
MKFSKTYSPTEHESHIYELWEKSDIFKANPKSSKPHFSISMPPPNETGTLHIGSSLFITLQDILARHARLSGKDVLWLPGTDHAALPTNAIMERKLAEEGITKHHIGREEFIKRTKEYVAANRDTINKQIRAMGASVDWSRYRYTLDDTLNRCVNEVFVKMYNDGLIYRGHRIVNWDPTLETNIADDEIEYVEEKGNLYTFKYGPFEIVTARPETKFGDKYVVMHPDDKRYAKYKHGEQIEVEWINGKILSTVIKDESVDPKFGTGVMTITPWHSQIDFEIAEKHNLDKEQIIDLKGTLLPIAEEFSGMSIAEARPKIVEKLDKKGLLVDVKKGYIHNLAVNSRGKGIIEPQIRLQWFIDVNKPVVKWKGKDQSLKSILQSVIREEDIKLIPDNFQKVYYHWIDNLRDWCISRQIWWGHQIPVWYKGDETYVGILDPEGSGWTRDQDTLDTWFSSSLWTWSTLIDTELSKDFKLSLEDLLKQSEDFQTYHPTSVLETGWDILFFWVARMILSTVYATKEVPFKTVYLHGLVRGESGKKMSKSDPDSIIDPLDIIDRYGCDALRLGLIQGMSAGTDQRVGESKFVTNRNFCNKLWNIARYITDTVSVDDHNKQPVLSTDADHWIINKFSAVEQSIRSDLDNYKFAEAYDKLYHFIWDDLADWYIEASKIQPNKPLLAYILRYSLLLAHPFAPFISEAIWQNLDWDKTLLASMQYEEVMKASSDKASNFEDLKRLISEIRYIAKSLDQKELALTFKSSELIESNDKLVKQLSRVKEINKRDQLEGLRLSSVKEDIRLNIDKEKARSYLRELEDNREKQKKILGNLRSRLANKNYVENAPEAVINQTKSQLSHVNDLLSMTESEIKVFSKL